MNPFQEKAKDIEKTYKSWKSINVRPYDKETVDPYTRVRVILMNGTEFEAIWNTSRYNRHCTNNDVRRIYTQKVSELLAKGYQIHYETMSGSQGELAHIDRSDGNEILRVLLERDGNYGGSYGSIVRLRVGRCNEDISRTHTIWNERLDTLFEIEWDQISGNYYTTREEGARMAAVRLERWRRRGHTAPTELGAAYKSAALRWIRRQPAAQIWRALSLRKVARAR